MIDRPGSLEVGDAVVSQCLEAGNGAAWVGMAFGIRARATARR
jgi:hypothetical protein